jgi:hypothetical protein
MLVARASKALDRRRARPRTRACCPAEQALAYQRALLDAVSLLNAAPPGPRTRPRRTGGAAVVAARHRRSCWLTPRNRSSAAAARNDAETLELIALERRPEIMEEWYRKRVTANDIRIAKAQVWPNLSLEAGPLYDSNKYLYNNNWSEAGLRLSFNLLKLLQWPALDEAQANQERTDETRRIALSMAILTQVHVGRQRYELALSELNFAEEIMRVDGRLLQYAKAAASTSVDSELEVIRAEARWLLARYQRQAAYSNAQAAWGRLYNSIGYDVMPDAIESHDIQTLAGEIRKTMADWEKAGLRPAETPAPAQAAG